MALHTEIPGEKRQVFLSLRKMLSARTSSFLHHEASILIIVCLPAPAEEAVDRLGRVAAPATCGALLVRVPADGQDVIEPLRPERQNLHGPHPLRSLVGCRQGEVPPAPTPVREQSQRIASPSI